jgi:hypothetical protein
MWKKVSAQSQCAPSAGQQRSCRADQVVNWPPATCLTSCSSSPLPMCATTLPYPLPCRSHGQVEAKIHFPLSHLIALVTEPPHWLCSPPPLLCTPTVASRVAPRGALRCHLCVSNASSPIQQSRSHGAIRHNFPGRLHEGSTPWLRIATTVTTKGTPTMRSSSTNPELAATPTGQAHTTVESVAR